jgi:hypothetical protein
MKPLPMMTSVHREQDMTHSSLLAPPEFAILRERRYLDSINVPWEPHTTGSIPMVVARRENPTHLIEYVKKKDGGNMLIGSGPFGMIWII